MSKSVEVKLEAVKADAELMSAWLGEMEDITISPKLLFDLQTLLRHYADFLVPNKDVSIDYEYEGTPCASVDKSQVFIPLSELQEGKVDCAIASVIHELHHIKHSYGETKICKLIMPYFERILDTVEVEHHGVKMSLWTALQSNGEVNAKDVTDRKLDHTYKDFIYQYFGDMFLLLNAIEDVRIDEMQPHNLKKYRFKQEAICFERFQKLYDANELDKNSFFGRVIDALFHLKGYGKSDYIANSNITADRIVAVDEPKQYYPATFSAFAEALQDHAGSLWNKYEEQNEMKDGAINQFLSEDAVEQQGNDRKDIRGDEELGLSAKKASDCSNYDGELGQAVRNNFGEEDIKDLLNAMNEEDSESPTEHLVMNPELWAEVQAFKALQHIPCREAVKALPQGVNYDTIILDCYA